MKVTLKGRIHRHGEVQQFESGFRKQEIVITPNGSDQYPDYFPIELMKDKVGALDNEVAGTEVSVDCYLGGREYNGRFFLSLKYAGHSVIGHIPTNSAPVQPAAPAPAASDDNLPF